jgi:hypothetical protein
VAHPDPTLATHPFRLRAQDELEGAGTTGVATGAEVIEGGEPFSAEPQSPQLSGQFAMTAA